MPRPIWLIGPPSAPILPRLKLCPFSIAAPVTLSRGFIAYGFSRKAARSIRSTRCLRLVLLDNNRFTHLTRQPSPALADELQRDGRARVAAAIDSRERDHFGPHVRFQNMRELLAG